MMECRNGQVSSMELGLLRLPSTGLPLGADFSMDLDLIVPDWLLELPKELASMGAPAAPAPGKAVPESASPKGPLHMRTSSGSASDSGSEEAGPAEDEGDECEDGPSVHSKSTSLTSQDSEAAARVRRSARLHGTAAACHISKPKEKRKVGRPIAWVGDPNSPDLTPQERRRIKRRIANRESARRVRARRQDMLEEMIEKAKEMEAANAEMQRHAQEVDEQCRALEAQAAEFHGRWRATAAENERLQFELAKLRDALAARASQLFERQQQGAQGKAAEPAPRAPAARAQSAALLDTVFPVEPMAVPLGSLLAA